MAQVKPLSAQPSLFDKESPLATQEQFSFHRNPHLEAIVRRFSHPFVPATDTYEATAFDRPEVDASPRPTYDMHMYWAKKPHGAIEQYIEHFTSPGDLVLDPMCGTGGTGAAALRLGRRAALIDISPAATFIARHLVTSIPPSRLQAAYEELYRLVKDEMTWLYETTCDRCGGSAVTAYVVHSQVYRCIKCFAQVPLYDCTAGKRCPHCKEPITTRQERFGYAPVETSYVCQNGCLPARANRSHNDRSSRRAQCFRDRDLAKLQEIEKRKIPYWYPTDPFPREWISWRPNLAEAGDVSGFFTKRNLWAAALIVDALQRIKDKECSSWLMFTFTGTLMSISKKAQHLEGGGGYIPGNYTFPPMIKERNALGSYHSVASKVLKGASYISQSYRSYDAVISTQSALDLSNIPSASVDYIFTDPPYSNKVPFGEFNFLWEVWLRKGLSWKDEEVIVNKKIGRGFDTWKAMMSRIVEECYRVLKPGRWLSVCYHDSAEGSWGLLQDAFNEAGFIADNLGKVLSIERDLKSFKQRTTENVQMRDLVVNFRKPKSGEALSDLDVTISGEESQDTFRNKVLSIIRGHLQRHPGSSRDRIYDEVVSRMVRAGQMEAHNFDALLKLVAEPTGEEGRQWILRDEGIARLDEAESAREDQAAKLVAVFIADRIQKHPDQDGVHYADVFEYYVYCVQNKPRRRLQEWVLDYFYKTPDGTYRLPASEEEEHLKAEERKKGTIRYVRRFLTYLEGGLAIPDKIRPNDATLAEWIRHCKRSGLYEQGKLLYEKGGLNLERLPEETMVDVEEDYQVCTRMLARSGGEDKKPKRGRRKKLEAEE